MVHRTRSPFRWMSSARAAFVWPMALAAGALFGGRAQAQYTPFQATINQAQEVPPSGSASAGFGFFAFNAAVSPEGRAMMLMLKSSEFVDALKAKNPKPAEADPEGGTS